MVRSGKTAEAQCVLFETARVSDLEAARWFARNGHRFEQVRERLKREKQREEQLASARAESRASSAKGRSRDAAEVS